MWAKKKIFFFTSKCVLYVGGCSYAGGRLVMSVSEPEDGFMSGSIELALLSESDCETAIGAETTDSTIWGWPWASELRKKKKKIHNQ